MNPKRRIIPVFVPNEGCRHNCVFCDQRRITGSDAPVKAEEVTALIEAAPKGTKRYDAEYSVDNNPLPLEIAFYGGSFTALPEPRQNELLKAAGSCINLDSQDSLRDSIRVSTRPDCIDDGVVARLKRFGVRTVELGAQSMCDEVLRASKRGHTASDVVRAAETIKSSGLSLILQMMTGLPCDTEEKSIETAKRFVQLHPDGVRIYPAVVVRGTGLHEMWLRGEYAEHTIDDAINLCVKLCTIFEEASIPIIRLGLNPTDALTAGDAAAGAYHPALGELVYTELFYRRASELLNGVAPGSDVVISVPTGKTSIMIGSHRKNVDRLMKNFALRSVKVIESSDVVLQVIPLHVIAASEPQSPASTSYIPIH